MLKALQRLIDRALGLDAMQPFAAWIARLGMRGVGINLHFTLDDSGEKRALQKIGARLPGYACLDVGANAGCYALAALESGASKVVAFEPVPSTFALLEANIGGRPVEAHNAAIGETTGDVEIFVPSNARLASRDPTACGFVREKTSSARIPMTTIDEYCFSAFFFPTLIKIDVEGFEYEALTGAQKLLSGDKKPAFVQFEFNVHHLYRGQSLADFENLLPGYHLYRLTASGLSKVGAHRKMDTIYGFMNILASLDEKPF